jgi:hypothetical protein
MWQEDTFDLPTIDRELGYAEKLGFNSIRVFLHNLPYQEDKEGFLKRIDQFLGVADNHHIGVMLVLLDGVWDPYPASGKQRAPRPHVHNSGWVQAPGAEILKDPAKQDMLKDYVEGVVNQFKNDKRVVAWDVFNEPDNDNPAYKDKELANKADVALQLLKKTFTWCREVKPSQPLTSAVWRGTWPASQKLSPTEECQIMNSDIISFHNYDNLDGITSCVENLKRFNRPIICTEYMARPRGSTFDPVLGYLKSQHVGAYNWGFVAGKTQTIYPWDSWDKQYTSAPEVWFHDILTTSGKPFSEKEVDYIKSLTRDNRTPLNFRGIGGR